jgi:diguanylate cyclase (GGDEF)-like protein
VSLRRDRPYDTRAGETDQPQEAASPARSRPDRVRVIAELREQAGPSNSKQKTPGKRFWLLRFFALVGLCLGVGSVVVHLGSQTGGASDTATIALICAGFALCLGFTILADRRERQALLAAANTDLLTGLPNRRQFMDELSSSLRKRTFAASRQVALLLIDLDRFKLVNDSFGHSAGDDLLREAASRLRNSISPADRIGRLGGDEFVVLRRGVEQARDVEHLAKAIVKAFERPFTFDDKPATVTASVGVALGQPGLIQPEELLIRADAAMYQAKDDQVSGLAMYRPEATMLDRSRLTRESELRAAIDGEELFLLYQPQYDLATLELVGFEALVRWNHPKLGLLTPDKFILLAEESRLINELSLSVVRQAFHQVNEWHAVYGSRPKLSVNLSALDLRRTEFLGELSQMLQGQEDIARDLVFEITETVLLRDPEGAAATLREIQSHGAKIAIDDFGTGYCSLSYLSRLPVEILKIDRSFVTDAASRRGRNLLKAIVELGHSLDMSMVLEGIESQQELGLAIWAGCDVSQGYFLGKPIPREAAAELLLTRQRVPTRLRAEKLAA